MSVSVPKFRGRSCLLYGLVICFLLPVLLVGIALLVFAGRDASAKRLLEKRIEKLQAEGLPVDDESMADFHIDATSRRDLDVWLGILEELQSKQFSDSVDGVPIFDGKVENPIPVTHGPWAEEETTRAFLNRWSDLHDRTMRLCMDAEPVRFPITWQSVSTLLPKTQEMRQAARLLSLRGQVAVYDRDAAAARRSIDALLGCATVLSGEPILVSQLVSIAIDGMAMDVLKKAVEQDVLRERDLEDLLQEVLKKTTVGPEWQLSMKGERAMMLPIFQNPELINANIGSSFLPFRSRDANNYLDLMENILEIPTTDLDQFQVRLEVEEAKLAEALSGSFIKKLDNMLTSMLTPAFSAAGSAFIRQALTHRIAALAMGARLYKIEHGKFPESLSLLEPYGVVASDMVPVGGKPFGYRLDEDRALLWGFSRMSEMTSVPDTPPDPQEGEPYVDQIRFWKWELLDPTPDEAEAQ